MVVISQSSFADAHRATVTALLDLGYSISTDYDKPGDPLSLDLPVAIEVTQPWNPPIFSKCVWDDAKGLLDYRDEVLYGICDHLVSELSYTYHDRIKDQIDGMVQELKRNPYTRRAQVITWIPEKDLGSEYPPCFQRAWARVRNGKLDFHTHWRSRDTLKAWGSNVFAFAHLHKMLAEEIGYPIGVYREFIDSAHIYGNDITMARRLLERQASDWRWSLGEIEKDAGCE